MICPNQGCRSVRLVALHPVFSCSMGWFGRMKKLRIGDAFVCWHCGSEFMVTMNGETIQRVSQQAQAPAPSIVPMRKREQPEPRESLVDSDLPVSPTW